MMEAVKIGRLDLIEVLLRAGARLDVQVSQIFPELTSPESPRGELTL